MKEKMNPIIKEIRKKLTKENLFKLMINLITDKTLRHRISLYFGGAVNFLSILFYFFGGIWYRSVWFLSISVFYLSLVLAKTALANMEKNARLAPAEESGRIQLTGYLRCGLFLLLVNFAMTGIAIQVIYKNKHYRYAHFLVIGIGAIAFCTLINTAVQLWKYAKTHTYLWSAVWSVNLASALFGMYTLQTALFAQFDPYSAFAHTMNYVSSLNIFVILFIRSLYMIINGRRHLKQ